MNSKIVEVAGVGIVTLTKRAQSRNLRLSVQHGTIRVSLPRWTPFSAGVTFAHSHADWIRVELLKQKMAPLESGQRIGKMHYLRFEQVLGGQSESSRVTATEVIVRMQPGEHSTDTKVQQRAHAAAIRALKREAQRLLPPRLQSLAEKNQLSYNSVGIKSLKRRWGSCDNHQVIVLNLYLMELPWDYIDYVLLHELTHTQHMDHSQAFWNMLSQLEPQARKLTKQLRTHQPALGNWQP